MNIMLIMHVSVLAMVAAAGAGVVLTRDPVSQIITLSFFGLILALFFLLMQAPDVALSQVVVGTVALPLMVLLALAKIRRDRQEKEQK
jgi:uncharacterized MnhB-related membrane protein